VAVGGDGGVQDNIPMCTLRNFPSLIEHCIEWARAQFNDLFVEPAGDAKKFLTDRETYLAQVGRLRRMRHRVIDFVYAAPSHVVGRGVVGSSESLAVPSCG
jgi:hypothetical protein